jgi:hypothetical protein
MVGRWGWFYRFVLTALLCVSAPVLLTGCPQLASLLPIVQTIITEIMDAERKLDQVDGAAQDWFKKYPNEAMQTQWATAVEVARAGLDVANKTAHGANEVGNVDPVAAFQHFNAAWVKLIELGTKIGIVSPGGEFGAGPNVGIVVQPPLCLSRGSAP